MLISYILSTIIISVLAFYLLELNPPKLRLRPFNKLNSLKDGRKLYNQLQGLNRIYLARGTKIELCKYKFFTTMAEELLVSYRREGVDIFGHTCEMRRNLNYDLKAQKKISEVLNSSFVEMAIISMLALGFQIFASLFSQIDSGVSTTIIIFIWQGLGATIFYFLQKWLHRQIFDPFYEYIKAASFLDISLLLGRPVNLITKNTNPNNLPKDKDLDHLKQRALQILEAVKNHGIYDREQSKELVQECWFVYEQKLEKYRSRCKALKLGVIAGFFLTSYLYLFYALVSAMS